VTRHTQPIGVLLLCLIPPALWVNYFYSFTAMMSLDLMVLAMIGVIWVAMTAAALPLCQPLAE
jgi:hypothetical protein